MEFHASNGSEWGSKLMGLIKVKIGLSNNKTH